MKNTITRQGEIEMNRDEQNKILRANGYKWVKYDQDELDDNDDFDRNPGWYLFAANGREVSVQRAMREIEIGVETVAKEIAESEERERERAELVRELNALKRQCADLIMRNGEKPDSIQPNGERVLDTQNLYGGGDWFVIEDKYIWYVKNNGMDGDNWSYNNVRTGGAGAIGWRMTIDTDVEDSLRAIMAGQRLREYRAANNIPVF